MGSPFTQAPLGFPVSPKDAGVKKKERVLKKYPRMSEIRDTLMKGLRFLYKITESFAFPPSYYRTNKAQVQQ